MRTKVGAVLAILRFVIRPSFHLVCGSIGGEIKCRHSFKYFYLDFHAGASKRRACGGVCSSTIKGAKPSSWSARPEAGGHHTLLVIEKG